ncbi:ImmA/IrrE family metallo-endopeptidase [Aedoeadaptatus coxii]|uniref:ImmA/IrrE family metallo-endopeptidase n=1 Tax=Aedoeadaptatus coxii TaxID=755172 RepID=UPI002AD47EB9|nr:ImmA/IrrE family metallo-endopeptidase [Peptoniphilus coxii]
MGKAFKKAKNLFNQCGTADPFKIADYKDYVVVKKEMPLKLKGFTLKKFRIPIIYINSLYDESEQEFTCLHEIGHIVCGHEDNAIFLLNNTTQVVNKYENEADDFACAMKLLSLDYDSLPEIDSEKLESITGIKRTTLLNFFNRNRTYIRSVQLR